MEKKKYIPVSAQNFSTKSSGQAITEVIIGLTISAIIVAVVGGAIALILRSNQENIQFQTASLLAQEYADNLQAIAEGNWLTVYNLSPKGTTSTYRVATSGAQYVIQSGTGTLTIDDIQYTRYFSIENVSRDSVTNNIEGTYSSANDDPSTQKVTAYVEWTRQEARRQISVVKYLARWQNKVTRQTDWGGGSGQEGPLMSSDNRFSTSTNISSSSTGSIILEGY